MLQPRIIPPLTVRGKPLVAEIKSSSWHRPADTESIGVVSCGIRFYRDRDGNSRTEYWESLEVGESSPAAVVLWSPADHVLTQVSFADRHIERGENPIFPSEQDWLPNHVASFAFANESRMIHAMRCTRVQLSLVMAAKDDVSSDELWVSEEWGLVMLDVVIASEHESRWEVSYINTAAEPEPDKFHLSVPAGFSVNSQ